MNLPRDLGADLAAAVHPVPGTVVVAWSGGVDSTALLDLAVGEGGLRDLLGSSRVVAAHLDHAMRGDSAEDAAALQETADAWGVDFVSRRLAHAPASEAEARTARYAFLREVCAEVDADQLWTAHHADDQVETVLFRIARGTGVDGLAGVPVRRGLVVRPLLLPDRPVSRGDLEAWATARRLPIRVDSTNAEAVAARNRLRHEVLPLLEEVVPGTRPALMRLSRNAQRLSEELEALAAFVSDRGGFESDAWAAAPEAQRRALLRFAAARMGVRLSEAATRTALRLDPAAQSGRGVDLPDGLRFERVFDRWVLRRVSRGRADARRPSLQLEGPEGTGVIELGHRRVFIRWGPPREDRSEARKGPGLAAGSERDAPTVSLSASEVEWPLLLRGWVAGDRLRRSHGTSSLAKLWSEARIAAYERRERWVLVEAKGRVLAAEGLGQAYTDPTIPRDDHSAPALHIHMEDLT